MHSSSPSGGFLKCLGISLSKRKASRTSAGRSDHRFYSPHGYAVTPFAFRAVQRLVGRSKNIAHRNAMVRKQSNAHRDAHGPEELTRILHAHLLHLLAQDLRPLEGAV